MKTNHVLIDFENVQVHSIDLLRDEQFRVWVFLGPNNTKLPRALVLAMHELGSRAAYVEMDTCGNNALDFHLAYYLGTLSSADPTGFFHVISRDTGFDPLLQHLRKKKIFCVRSASIEEMPCFIKDSGQAKSTAATTTNGDPVPSRDVRPDRDALVSIVLEDLVKRKAAMPRSEKTLRSTIQARCGKQVPAAEIDAIYGVLVARGHVKIEGNRLAYELPTPAQS